MTVLRTVDFPEKPDRRPGSYRRRHAYPLNETSRFMVGLGFNAFSTCNSRSYRGFHEATLYGGARRDTMEFRCRMRGDTGRYFDEEWYARADRQRRYGWSGAKFVGSRFGGVLRNSKRRPRQR